MKLAMMTQARLCDDFGLEPLSKEQFGQMVAIPIPDCDLQVVKERLYDEFNIEVTFTRVDEKPNVRVSYQAYNSDRRCTGTHQWSTYHFGLNGLHKHFLYNVIYVHSRTLFQGFL